jgi:hypothetical protein
MGVKNINLNMNKEKCNIVYKQQICSLLNDALSNSDYIALNDDSE